MTTTEPRGAGSSIPDGAGRHHTTGAPARKPSRHRRRRGAETQRVVAGYLAKNGWPYATDAGAGRSGVDILGVPGLSIEVKARRDLSLPEWLRQASKQDAGLPLVAHRPDGMGPATVADWPVTMRLADIVWLLREAGYGDPNEDGEPR